MSQTLIQPYLFLAGRADEAIEFYRTALHAAVEMRMPYSQSPEPSQMPLPAGWENKVMHASLRIGGSVLMLSDGCSTEHKGFHGVSLTVNTDDEAEARRVFAALSEGGEVEMPLTKTFFSPAYGMVKDRFGLLWMVYVSA